MCNRSLRQTAISFSSAETEYCAASACAGELLGLAELFKELHTFQFVSRWIKIRHDTFYSTEDQADAIISKYDACQYNSGYEKNVCRWIEWTRKTINTADLFTKHLDGPRTQSLTRKLALRILEGANGDD